MPANARRTAGALLLFCGALSCSEPAPEPTVPAPALTAMRADFHLDGRTASRAVVADLYARACEGGWQPACSPPSSADRDERMREMATTLRVSHPAVASWLDGHEPGERSTLSEKRQTEARVQRRFQHSCELGFAPACVDALKADRSLSWSDRFNASVDWCDAGVVQGCTIAASVAAGHASPLCDDAPCAGGDERAIALWTAACDGGDWSACTSLAREASRRGSPLDDDAARTLATSACADGAIASCALVSYLYDTGRILECDPGEMCDIGEERASNGYSRGCAAGDSWSCTRLARRHRQGLTGLCGEEDAPCERSHARAYPMFVDACDGGTPAACTMAGNMARSGQSSECAATHSPCSAGDQRALAHFTQACEGPMDPEGCFAAARLLQAGRGVEEDMTQAARMLRARSLLSRSCFMFEHTPSCRMLARRHGQTVDGVTIVDGTVGWTDLMCADGSCRRVCSQSAGASCTDSDPFPLDAG